MDSTGGGGAVRAADYPLAFKAYYAGMKVSSSFSTRLAGWFAHRIWFTPWTVKPGERGLAKQAQWLSPTTPVRFATPRGRVVGFEAGSGPVALLVHGWGERAADLGGFIEPLTRAGYRVVGLDLLGHGDSDDAEPNLYVVSETIREVGQQLGGLSTVVAHSMGGHSTLVALRDGLDVDSLVLLSPSSQLEGALWTFTKLLSLPPRAATGLRRKLEQRFGTTLWSEMEGSALIRDVTIPALIVHDRDDPQIPLQDSEALASAWDGARLLVTDGLGHGRTMRDQNVISEAISFLNEHTPNHEKELEDANR